MAIANPLFSEQVAPPQTPRYGQMRPTRSFLHLKVTFDTTDKQVHEAFKKEFTDFINEYITQHGLPMDQQEAYATPAGSGLTKRSALRTQLVLTAHLDNQSFADFVEAVQLKLPDMPGVTKVRCSNHHNAVNITAAGLESV